MDSDRVREDVPDAADRADQGDLALLDPKAPGAVASARQTRHAKPGDGPEARRIGPCPRPDGQSRQPFSSSVAPRRMREPTEGRCQSREPSSSGKSKCGLRNAPMIL